MLSSVLSFIAKPFADTVGQWQSRKTLAAKSEAQKINNQLSIDAAMAQAKINRLKDQNSADAAYDLLVLENRKTTIMDELLIVFWLGVFAMHFIPKTAPMMADGWAAIMGAPWWFQFGMLGILVSTLGLMRLFREWTRGKISFSNK
jgi:hypothetical protein